MADEKEVKQDNEPKKGKKAAKGKGGKKGKLPVIIALVAVLSGGGFFGMKMAGGSKHKEEPKLELGDDSQVINLGEFMVNTSDGSTYLKATVVLHLAKDAHLFGEGGGHGEGPSVEALAPYVDSVREVLSSQTMSSLTSAKGEESIKRQIAEKINQLFAKRNPEKIKELPKPEKGGSHPTWQSDTGPVLVVYFTELIWD